ELARAREVLAELLRAGGLEAPSRLLQRMDRLTGYTAVLANLPDPARREADWRGVLDLVRELERGAGDLFGVVRRLRRLVQGEVEVPRPPLEAGDAVALMTIHGSKGLEWPVVVVPDLSRVSPGGIGPVAFDPELGVAMKVPDQNGERVKPALYVLLEARKREREEAEAQRLLYVALTRARDALILTAADGKGGSLETLRPGLEAASIPMMPIPF